MANFAHLMDTMSRVRKGSSDQVVPRDPNRMPDLTQTSYYVGSASKSLIERVMASAPGGDFVVRVSERVPNSLVLMLKTSATAGVQRRITYANGMFMMDIRGAKCSHESLTQLLQLDPVCRRPVAQSVLRAASGAPSASGSSTSASTITDTSSSSSSSGAGVRAAAAPSASGRPKQSSRDVLEAAMTAAETGDFTRAMELVKQAKVLGASPRNLDKAIGYIQSLSPQGTLDANAAIPQSPPKQPPSDAGDARFNVVVRESADATRLGLKGEAVCTVTHDCSITLHTATTGAMVRPEHRWPLPLLRRYGRKGGAFYFESGRRCASGPALITLQTSQVDAIFAATEARLAKYRAKAEGEERAKAEAIAALQEKQRKEEEEAEKHRQAAIAQYQKEAERLVRQEEEAMRNEEKERAKREEAEKAETARKAANSPADDAETRASMIHRRNSAAAKRQEQAKHLTLSKRAEAQLEPKTRSSAAELFKGGSSAPEEEWGAGKSKIWKALNPKPLYYETAKDRRQREEGTVELGAIGTGRNFNAMRDMMSPELNAAEDMAHPAPTGNENDANEVANASADDDDAVDRFNDDADAASTVIGDGADEEESDDDDDDGPVGELDPSLLELLEKNRAQRAREEEEHKRKLREEFARAQAAKQAELDKELAVIEVKRKKEEERKRREKEEAVKEAQKRIETELVFDFTWGS